MTTQVEALAQFTEYFAKNYPGPNTIIGDPHWHAPKIFRAALAALATVSSEAQEPTSKQNARFAIDGAIQYGKWGTNKPPSDDHWLMEYWNIGRDLAKAASPAPDVRPSVPAKAAIADVIKRLSESYNYSSETAKRNVMRDAVLMLGELGDALHATKSASVPSPDSEDTPDFDKGWMAGLAAATGDTPESVQGVSDNEILDLAEKAFGRSREFSNCFQEPSERGMIAFVRTFPASLPAAPVQQEPEFEDGPDSEGFKGPRPWNGFQAAPSVPDEPDWVILQRPGLVPMRKGPFNDKKHVEDMLRDLYELYPDCTCTVINMPGECYPESGREWISIYGDKRRKALPPEAQTAPSVSGDKPDAGSASGLLPVGTLAWALVTPTGNIRYWSHDRKAVEVHQAQCPNETLVPIIGAAADEGNLFEREFNAKRLRRVVNLVGLGAAVPESDADLLGCMGSVLGMVASKLEGRSVSADAADQMDIDREGARFWHRNCTNQLGGVMKVIKDEPTQSLIQCLHCGKSGYYPVGGVGRIRAAIAAQSKGASE